MPNNVEPWKNCTWAMAPLVSAAFALTVMLAGAVKVAFGNGDVIATDGAVLAISGKGPAPLLTMDGTLAALSNAYE